MGVHCCYLHVNYIVYKHFDRSLHVGSLDLTCVQNFRPVSLTVFEILGFKLKNNNKKNWSIPIYKVLPYFVITFVQTPTLCSHIENVSHPEKDSLYNCTG